MIRGRKAGAGEGADGSEVGDEATTWTTDSLATLLALGVSRIWVGCVTKGGGEDSFSLALK